MTALIPGESYHIDDIQSAFGTSLGWYVKGIVPRRDSCGRSYILLFSSFLNTSGSWLEGNKLYVRGEGKTRDQEPRGANLALMQAESDNRAVYGFRKERRGRVWRYLGRLEPMGHEVADDSGRMIYVFCYAILSE